MSAIKKLVVGLGNPGQQYAATRHNVGWMVLDQLATEGFSGWQSAAKLNAAVARSADGAILLFKPQTFMNESGQAVRAATDFYTLEPSEVLVVSDEAALPFGELRYRSVGSSAGQKGLQSIINHLGTAAVPRLRFGIGDQRHPDQELSDYVLAPFSAEERVQLAERIDAAVTEVKAKLQ